MATAEVSQRYEKSTSLINSNLQEIIEEIIFLKHTQTAILRNDFYLVKDKDTQSIFESVLCKNQPKITPNNHQKAFDLKHMGNLISIKSGTVVNDVLKFSYSRSSEYPDLQEKINYLSTFENLILGLASEKVKSNNPQVFSKTRYYLYHFPANHIDMKSLTWTETPNQYMGLDKDKNISVEIRRKLSDQPWISLPLSQIYHQPLIETSITSHKNRKYLIIDNLMTNERHYYDIYEQRKKIKALKGIQRCSIPAIKQPAF